MTQTDARTDESVPTDDAPDRILVVDDEANIRRLVDRYLSRIGYEVETAADVPEAVGMLAENDYDLVLTDLKLPGPSGLELLLEVRARTPDTRLIMMSAHADVPAAAAAIERGIDHLLIKPFDLDELKQSVATSLARRRAANRAARERRMLEERLRRRDTESRIYILRAAHALTAAVEAKDAYTAGHAVRVTAYAITLAEETGGIDLLRFRLAGELHDVGKIGVPDTILNKPERLTPDEFTQVKEHPEIGERILSPLIDDELVMGVVRNHHERWDGTGYPDGLSTDEIPLGCRVLAIADTLDAMTSARAYRSALSWATAVEEVRRCSGTQFDPDVVKVFESTLPQLRDLYEHFVATDELGSLRAAGTG